MSIQLKDVVQFYFPGKWVVTEEDMYYDDDKESMGHCLAENGDIIEIDILTAPFLLRYGAASSATNWIEYLCTHAKPLLWRLEDMTEEEMKELYKLLKPKVIIDDIIEIKLSFKPVARVDLSYNSKDPAYRYMTDWFMLDKNTPTQFLYLHKQQLDLYGLIDSGQAIDAKSISPVNTQP